VGHQGAAEDERFEHQKEVAKLPTSPVVSLTLVSPGAVTDSVSLFDLKK